MSNQVWEFVGIDGSSMEMQGYVKQTDGLLDEGKASLAALASVWGGSGSEAYQAVQARWDSTSAELNAALQNLAQTIGNSGQNMKQVEDGVTGMFI
jgi:early secretory antigenic target protein ESAT-6